MTDRQVHLEMWQVTSLYGTGNPPCQECLALNGLLFPEGEGPTVPLHAHCRCRRVPLEGLDEGADFIRAGLNVLAWLKGKVGP